MGEPSGPRCLLRLSAPLLRVEHGSQTAQIFLSWGRTSLLAFRGAADTAITMVNSQDTRRKVGWLQPWRAIRLEHVVAAHDVREESMPFRYDLDFKQIDFRRCPELYHIGKGEQGVLLVEPYKSELLPHWSFQERPPSLAWFRRTPFIKTICALQGCRRFRGDGHGAQIPANGVHPRAPVRQSPEREEIRYRRAQPCR